MNRLVAAFEERRWAILTFVVLLVAACGGTSTLDITVEPADDVDVRIDSLERLDLRVFTIAEVDEPYAIAVAASGGTVEGVSCAAIEVLAPDATGCEEGTRRLVRDRDLVHRGQVPADGRLSIERPDEDLRIRVELPGTDLTLDDQGRLCVWTGVGLVDAGASTARVVIEPRC